MKPRLNVLYLTLAFLLGPGLFQISAKEAEINGKKIYNSKCASCHGKNGKGMPVMAKVLKVDSTLLDMTSSQTVQKKKAELLEIISSGINKMPGYVKKMSAEEIEAVLQYMLSLSSKNNTGKPSKKQTRSRKKTKLKSVKLLPQESGVGKKLYRTNCASCHGKDGRGVSSMAMALKVQLSDLDMTTEETLGEEDSELLKIISKGDGKMPAYSTKITPEDQILVLKYMRSLGIQNKLEDSSDKSQDSHH